MQLQNELVDTEDKIQSARRFYNSVTRDFNTKIQQFPNSIIANIFKFKEEEFFEIQDEEQRENVEVSFNKEVPAQTEAPKTEPVAETPVAPAEPAPAPTPEPVTPAKPDEAESKIQAEPEAPLVDHPDQTTLPDMEGEQKEDTPQA